MAPKHVTNERIGVSVIFEDTLKSTDPEFFLPGGIIAVSFSRSTRKITVNVPRGVSLTLTVASIEWKEYSDMEKNWGQLQYSNGRNLRNTLLRFSPQQLTISNLGLSWDGPQVFDLYAFGATISIVGTIRRDYNENVPIQPNVEVQTLAVEQIGMDSHRPPKNSRDSSSREDHTQSKTKRKLDAQALVDELAEMQGVDANPQEILISQVIADYKNETKRNKMEGTHGGEDKINVRKLDNATTTSTTTPDETKATSEPISDGAPLTTQDGTKSVVAEETATELKSKPKPRPTPSASTDGINAPIAIHHDSRLKERRLKSGVLVKDILLGKGKLVQPGRKVFIQYTASFPDGTIFDSSKSNTPLHFRLGTGQVVRGLEDGIMGMREGGQRALVIPPELAYGAQGSGKKIPPFATLLFTVSLESVGGM